MPLTEPQRAIRDAARESRRACATAARSVTRVAFLIRAPASGRRRVALHESGFAVVLVRTGKRADPIHDISSIAASIAPIVEVTRASVGEAPASVE